MDLPYNVDFTGKVVVVTGAGGVLCGDMARAFAKAGAKVAALDINFEAVEKLAIECRAGGWTCLAYKADVLSKESLETAHRRILSDLGPCDILINGAGGNNPRATTDNEYQHEPSRTRWLFGIRAVLSAHLPHRGARYFRLLRRIKSARNCKVPKQKTGTVW